MITLVWGLGMERVGHVYRVKPGNAADYARRHATIPTQLDALLRETGVHRYTIYLWGETVFTHMEVDDFQAMVDRYNGNPVAESWEAEMGDLIEYPDADPKTGWPHRLEELWNL
jgi:L-rhamnose mutarotase